MYLQLQSKIRTVQGYADSWSNIPNIYVNSVFSNIVSVSA
jgi:hypothetical protein